MPNAETADSPAAIFLLLFAPAGVHQTCIVFQHPFGGFRCPPCKLWCLLGCRKQRPWCAARRGRSCSLSWEFSNGESLWHASERRRARRMKRALETTPSPARTKRKKPRRRVRFADGPDHVKVFDKRDPVGEDFHAVFADSAADAPSSPPPPPHLTGPAAESVLQPLTASPSHQTTPQRFSLRELVPKF